MIEGEKRRSAILAALGQADKPISATRFAKEFGVSRQIIVGDIALLRASGQQIIATARGYLLESETQGLVAKIAVQHGPEQTEEELKTIVEKGGEIIDVVVEHPLYGELQGRLDIRTAKDVNNFMKNYLKQSATLLSELTEGIHLHTIRCETPADLAMIKQALLEKKILYREQ